MGKLSWLDWLCYILVIIGGLNWLLVGAFNFDLVKAVFGDMTLIARIVYILVGVAALYILIFLLPKACKKKAAEPAVQS